MGDRGATPTSPDYGPRVRIVHGRGTIVRVELLSNLRVSPPANSNSAETRSADDVVHVHHQDAMLAKARTNVASTATTGTDGLTRSPGSTSRMASSAWTNSRQKADGELTRAVPEQALHDARRTGPSPAWTTTARSSAPEPSGSIYVATVRGPKAAWGPPTKEDARAGSRSRSARWWPRRSTRDHDTQNRTSHRLDRTFV